jgi:hypothetical protein
LPLAALSALPRSGPVAAVTEPLCSRPARHGLSGPCPISDEMPLAPGSRCTSSA